jgi:glycosyltransferase involved in cell wall biosynthesis
MTVFLHKVTRKTWLLLNKAWHFLVLRTLARPSLQEEGFNIFGYFSKMLGQGEVVRAFADDMIEKGEKIALVDFYENNHGSVPPSEIDRFRKYFHKPLQYGTNLFFIDIPVIPTVRRNLPFVFKNKRNIAVFWWEFESGFEDRIPILNQFEEVYVFSDFIKETLNALPDRRFIVTKIKYPFKKNWIIEESPAQIREGLGLQGKFCFFFNFDYKSSYHRKNPEATLKALHDEFEQEKNVVFVVKTTNSKDFNSKENRFQQWVDAYDLNARVIIIKQPLTRNEFMSLLNAMDCFVSLHRGEGLGLGILEALALNLPVIATNYGGNKEYMDSENAYPVDYTLVDAHDDYASYRGVRQWAEPDHDCARKQMRAVYIKAAAGFASYHAEK